MEHIIIRDVKKEDIPEIVDIKINGWKNAYKGIISDDILNSMKKEENIKRIEENYTKYGFIVAVLNNNVVGFCSYVDSNKYTKDISNIDSEILSLYVRPEFKYNGIGTKLFKYVIDELREKNKSKMILWCLKENEPSKKFYEKMGGKIITTRMIEIGNNNYCEVGFCYDI